MDAGGHTADRQVGGIVAQRRGRVAAGYSISAVHITGQTRRGRHREVGLGQAHT